MKKYLSFLLVSFFFAGFAQAYEISTKIGSSVSNTLSVNSYSVYGTVKTIADSQRDVFDYTGGIITVGDMNKHSVVTVHVNQGGSGVGVSGSSTVYGGMTHGLVEVGASASVGWEASNSVGWDNSAIHETGVAVVDVDMWDINGFPNHVGSSTETTYTNTWVNLANVDYTASSGNWSGSAVYIK